MSLPEGYSAPANVISASDRGGWLAITNGIVLVIIVVFLALRMFKLHPLLTAITYDDVTITTAAVRLVHVPRKRSTRLMSAFKVLAIVQIVLNFTAIARGFGKIMNSLDSEALMRIEKVLLAPWSSSKLKADHYYTTYASDLLYLVSLCLSKISALLLALRLSPDRLHQLTTYGVLVLTTVLFMLSILLIALSCNLSRPWSRSTVACKDLVRIVCRCSTPFAH